MAISWSFALRFVAGRYKGGEFPLRPNREIVVGRGSEFDMVLEEDMVSRRHAKISTFHGRIVFEDLGSTNGSFINGQKVEGRALLSLGDKLLVGTSLMEVVQGEGSGITRTVRASAAPQPLSVPPNHETTDAMPARAFAQHAGPTFVGPTLQSPALGGAGPASGTHPVVPSVPPGAAAAAATRGMPRATVTVDQRSSGMRGRFPDDGVSVPDLVELFLNGQRTGVLVLADDAGREGRLFFREGELYFATVAEPGRSTPVSAQKAAFRLLAWPAGTFAFENVNPPPRFDVELEPGTRDRLHEAARQADELARYAGHLPAITARLALRNPLEARLSALSAEALDTLQVAINCVEVGRVLDQSEASDLETWQDLLYLLQNEYLVEV